MNCKNLKVKSSLTMVEKTLYEVEIPISEVRYKDELETPTSNSSERQGIVASNYHLVCYKVK